VRTHEGREGPVRPGHFHPEEPLNIEIQIQPVSGSTLTQDYLRGTGTARSFFAGSPREVEAYRAKLGEVQSRFGRAEREAAAAALHPTSDRARDRLARFVEEGGAMVTTGQQAGFLTGPLYTIHKALSTVRLAAALESRLGVPVLPVFWVASEDHDWEEANHAYLECTGSAPARIALPGPLSPSIPMSDRLLDEGVRISIDEVSQIVGNKGYANEVLKWIREAYRPGQTVGGAFGELLGKMLAGFDICIADAADPALKRASAGVLTRALERAGELEERLRARTAALEEAGYHGQVAVVELATNVFYHAESGRERLYRGGAGYEAREAGVEIAAAGVAEVVAGDPGRFSPNVLLRPIVESAVFPTLAYVGGPGEIAYFAQVTALFPAFGIAPPVVVPRGSVVLVDPVVRRLMDRLGVELNDVARPRSRLETELARREIPTPVAEALERMRETVAGGYAEAIDGSGAIEGSLAGSLGRLRNEVLHRLAQSETKVIQGIKRRDSAKLAQLDRILWSLRPEGKPQDRVLNVVSFLARFGPSLLTRIAEALDPELDEGTEEGLAGKRGQEAGYQPGCPIQS
jgi:bacillithiol biosynthesis cysteine-adding enzyme BshC